MILRSHNGYKAATGQEGKGPSPGRQQHEECGIEVELRDMRQ